VSQPTDPNFASSQPAPASAYAAAETPPVDDGSYIHPHQRAVLWVTRAITYLVYAFVLAVEIILILGFFLLLGGANTGNSFVDWAYRNLDRVMKPFRGIFTPIELGTAGSNEVQSVFDTSVLFAMIIYAILGIVIYGFASWLTKRLHRLDIEDRDYHARAAYERQAYLNRMAAERAAQAQAAALAHGTAVQSGVPPTQAQPTTVQPQAPAQPTQETPNVPPPPA
jgi:hypothetical protein